MSPKILGHIWAPPHPKQPVQNKFKMSSLYEEFKTCIHNIKIPTKIKKASLGFITFYNTILPINKKNAAYIRFQFKIYTTESSAILFTRSLRNKIMVDLFI